MSVCYEKICEQFISDEILDVTSLGNGHINDTYLVRTLIVRFVLQRISRDIDIEILENNYNVYSKCLDDANLLYPKWLEAKGCGGSHFFVDDKGDSYRMYPYVEGVVGKAVGDGERAALEAIGAGLARVHGALNNDKNIGTIRAAYPRLHDLGYYYERYLAVKDAADSKRDAELEEIIEAGVAEYPDLQLPKNAVVHGDPKLANMIFKNGQLCGIIDMDTVMMGSILEDIGDCIRSTCYGSSAIKAEAAQAIVKGYKSVGNNLVSDYEWEMLPKVVDKICFELGLRYYTDAVSGNRYFKESFSGENMQKARALCYY